MIWLAVAVALSVYAQSRPQQPARPAFLLAPQRVYSSDAHDPWNRLFTVLFSRRFQAYLSSDFPEGAPFADPLQDRDLRPSVRLFDRQEFGDRAIDPLYYPPYHTREGRRQLLLDPAYSEFMSALQDALADNSPRSPVARAWMQSDLWSAHDILGEPLFTEDRSAEMDARHAAALDAIARLMRKIALTPEEIQALPDNYSQAMKNLGLPDLFNSKAGWVEIQWFPDRMHDQAAEYRRYSRIFVKPVHFAEKTQKLLDALRNPEDDPTASLDGAAILMQLILIDSQGKMTPTRLATEVEVRNFEKTPEGKFQRTNIQVAEISRREALQKPQSGGLLAEDQNAQAYFGNYAFAAPTHPQGPSGEPAPPLVVKLRTRCTRCHDQDLKNLSTFEIKEPPHFHAPAVKQLNPAAFDAANYDISRKEKWLKSLRDYF
jgi:hypothetical protein